MIADGILYAQTGHTRHVEVKRSFTYSHFMFALDLLNLEKFEPTAENFSAKFINLL